MNNFILFVIMCVVCFIGYNVYADNKAEQAGKDEPLACIFGYDSGNC